LMPASRLCTSVSCWARVSVEEKLLFNAPSHRTLWPGWRTGDALSDLGVSSAGRDNIHAGRQPFAWIRLVPADMPVRGSRTAVVKRRFDCRIGSRCLRLNASGEGGRSHQSSGTELPGCPGLIPEPVLAQERGLGPRMAANNTAGGVKYPNQLPRNRRCHRVTRRKCAQP
jgi:hypothetical protein